MSASNRSTSTYTRRTDAKSKWNESETAKASSIRTLQQFTIKFEYGAMLLASVAAGDMDETVRLLREGADVNYSNIDGLTPLHQACIDENFAMVKLLVDNGANIDACDNEGWTPLHAAASSRSVEIIKYLANKGANLVAVNSEGELPIDLTEVPQIEKYLEDEINRRGLDMDDARDYEEKAMLEDAKKWKRDGKLKDLVDPQGATPLHVAASKGYLEVAKILLSLGADPNAMDNDGWTPLHAAVHWKQEDMCKELVSKGASLNALSYNGQTPMDLADDEMKPILKELSIKYRVNLTNDKSALKASSIKKTNKEVIGILKTSKKSSDKKSDIPKPLLPPTKIVKPEPITVTEPKVTQTATTSSSIQSPSKPSSVSKPPTKLEITKPSPVVTHTDITPTNNTETPEKSKTSAIPKPTTPSISTVPKPSTPSISTVPKPSTPSTSAVSRPSTSTTPKTSNSLETASSKDITPNDIERLKNRITELEKEVTTLKAERDSQSKLIQSLQAKINSLEITSKSSISTPQRPTSSISRPPGK